MKRFATLTAFMFLLACKSENEPNEQPAVNNVPAPANIGYNIVNIFPHDTASYTQGLEWHNGFLYEGTGLEGESRLMKVNIINGAQVQEIAIDNSLFGEGITILNDKIYQQP